MKSIISKSINETEKFVKDWFYSINKNIEEATLICLYGNLGSGKTTFTQSLAKELGVKEFVTSPTFVIEKIYETQNKDFKRLIHIDAYRLNGGKELQILGFEELINNTNNLIVIEWPENVIDILPENHIKIHCEFVNENSRKFDVQ